MNYARHLAGILVAGSMLSFAAGATFAQDATKADPKHYKVEFENERVRVLRITYGPGEKSKMHQHPGGVAVFLTDGQIKFHLPGGKSMVNTVKAGQFTWAPATKHQPENLGKKPLEVILIEMKTK
jgi:quercetin dioxygenase-like cupin family protein